jgi:hypothetical protein
MVVDAVVSGDSLRDEIRMRLDRTTGRSEPRPPKKHLVPPV